MRLTHLISNKREWNKCVIKNNQDILLDLADFALQEQPEDNFMVAVFRAWYNGSYQERIYEVVHPRLLIYHGC